MLTQEHLATAAAVLGLTLTMSPLFAEDDAKTTTTKFDMVVSEGAKTCLPKASGTVRITPVPDGDILDVAVEGLPPNADFDLFVLQVPKAPFGVAWYQGDIHTDKNGRGHSHFIGIFSIETFAVAVGSAPAPVVFNGPFPDASLNPPFNPIQMYHLGLWFDSPQTALAAGCAGAVTPFNGEHNAGIQVLNTGSFPDDHGPLRDVKANP